MRLRFKRLRRLTCCCCDASTQAYAQWWNRDTGYGLCGRCAVWLMSRPDYNEVEFTDRYGHAGVHWLVERR